MTVDALGLGGAVEPLRIGAKKQDSRMCRFSLFQQIEVGKQCLCRCVGLEREGALAAGGIQKPLYTFTGQMMKRSVVAGRCVEGGTRSAPFPSR